MTKKADKGQVQMKNKSLPTCTLARSIRMIAWDKNAQLKMTEQLGLWVALALLKALKKSLKVMLYLWPTIKSQLPY